MQGKRLTSIPGLMYLWKVDNLYLAGQPQDISWEAIEKLNIKKVFNLRGEDEADFSFQEGFVSENKLDYEQFPICKNGALIPEACERLSSQLNEEDNFFIHCGSANRVGGWLMTYLTQYRGMSFEDAVEVAQENGLSNPAFIEQAQEIIEKK